MDFTDVDVRKWAEEEFRKLCDVPSSNAQMKSIGRE
jgi:hypothetical protein